MLLTMLKNVTVVSCVSKSCMRGLVCDEHWAEEGLQKRIPPMHYTVVATDLVDVCFAIGGGFA